MPVDYDALAKENGAISPGAPGGGGAVAPDYDALAQQNGATDSQQSPVHGGVADAMKHFAASGADELNPVKLVQGLHSTIESAFWHPIDTVKAMAQGNEQALEASKAAYKRGEYKSAAAHFLNYILPFGSAVEPATQQIEQGDVAGGLGRSVGLGVALAAPGSPLVKDASGAVVKGATGIATRVAERMNANPLSAEALQLAQKLGVRLTRGMTGGSPAVQGAEKALALGVAGDLHEPLIEQAQGALKRGAADLGGGFVTDRYEAGANTTGHLLQKAQQFHDVAQDEYANLARLEADPGNVKQVQTGTTTAPAQASSLVDALGRQLPAGEPVQQAVTEKIGLPTDMRPVKRAVAPLIDDVSRRMDAATRRADPGLAALQNILTRPDVLPASVAEADLGYLKSIGRSDATAQAKRLAGIAVDALQPQVDSAVAQAGPDALDSLQRARSSWAQHAQILDLVKELSGDQAGEAGQVRVANKLLQPGDAAYPALQRVLAAAPETARSLGQAYLTDRVFKGLADGSDTLNATQGSNLWNQMGPRTKAALFPGRQISDIDHFFDIAKRVQAAQIPQSSLLSTLRGLSQLGAFAAHPFATGGGLLLGRNIAKILYYPDGAAALSSAIEGAGTEAGGAAVQRIQNILQGGGNAGRTAETGPGQTGAVDSGATQSRAALSESIPAGAAAPTNRTTIDVPGEARSYPGQYEVRDLSQIQPSHNSSNFQPNPKYELRNDRDYDNPVNQAKIVNWSAKGPTGFKPANMINTAPDSSSGPPVIDSRGNVLGGNGRTMILQRVSRGNPEGAAAYRLMLDRQAAQFGIDPLSYTKMKNPTLVRVIDDAEFSGPQSKQVAVTDFNKTGTASLTPSERSIADSRRVSVSTLEDISHRLEDRGPDATLAQILEGDGGSEILGRLVSDGVISPQERAELISERGLTKAGKDRISSLMLGRFFNDPAQMDEIAPAVRNKIERIAAPLARTEGPEGFDLSQHVRQAIDLIQDAKAHGASTLEDFIRQNGLFGDQKFAPQAVQLANRLLYTKPLELQTMAREYAKAVTYAREYQGPGLFGDLPDPEKPQAAFDWAFGGAVKR